MTLAVLVVDDSENDTLLMVHELRRSGFAPAARRVDTAGAMARALEEQAWDLVLADYRMPAFSGPEALALLQQTGLDVPFILVSATVGEESAVSMMKAGAHDFVLKSHLGRLGAAVARELRDAEVRRQRRWAEAALEMLAESGKLLVEAPGIDAVASQAAELAVPRLADWSIVYARDRVWVADIVRAACRDDVDREALDELARAYPPQPDGGGPLFEAAVRAHTPTLLREVSDATLPTLARDDRQLALLRRLDVRSLIVIPQLVHDQLAGLLVFAARRAGRFSTADLGVATEFGGRMALVVENVRLTRAREEFISTAVHEIKTPIAVIKTAVQLAQALPPDQREARMPELLVRLDRQCTRLSRLVTEVLEVSRLDLRRMTLSRRPTDLAALVVRVVGEMRDVGRDHQLVITRNDAITIDIDTDRIEQVLTNLLANAIKYTPGGGTIEVASRRTDGSVEVSVRDRGIGIPRDKQARVFERFYRAHAGTPYEHTSSLGVGLYLSREFVERHGGRIWFESQEGVGSVFGFRLPLSEDKR